MWGDERSTRQQKCQFPVTILCLIHLSFVAFFWFLSYYFVHHQIFAVQWKWQHNWPAASLVNRTCVVPHSHEEVVHFVNKKRIIRHQPHPLLPAPPPPRLRNRPYLASQPWWGERFVRRSLPESRNQPFTGLGAQYTTVQPKSKDPEPAGVTYAAQEEVICFWTLPRAPVRITRLTVHSSLDLPPSGNLSLFVFLMPVQSYVTTHYTIIKD